MPRGPDSQRGYVERNSIALLNSFIGEPIDPPSPNWLGPLREPPNVCVSPPETPPPVVGGRRRYELNRLLISIVSKVSSGSDQAAYRESMVTAEHAFEGMSFVHYDSGEIV